MESWAKGTNRWLSLGASLYWASYAFRIMDAAPAYAAPLGIHAPIIGSLFMAICVVACYAVCRYAGVQRGRSGIAAAVVVAACAVLVCNVGAFTLPPGAALVASALDHFTLGANMVLWGLAFASLEKHRAANSVLLTVLIAAAAILAGQGLAAYIPYAWMVNACTICSAAVLLAGRVPICNHRRAALPRPRRDVAVLLGQRLAYGATLGFFPFWVGLYAQGQVNVFLFAFTLGVLAVATIATSRASVPPYTILPTLLLVAAFALCLPTLRDGAVAILPSLVSGIWLAWQTLSSVQLSDLKERLGMSELAISLADKVAIAGAVLVGSGAQWVVSATLGSYSIGPEAVEVTLPMAFFALVFWATFELARLVGVHQENAFRDQAVQISVERAEQLFADIGAEFGLSPREREVFMVLVQGYTSEVVADKTGITHGTVKAHIAHIYRKLGVHNRDEMLHLVTEREEALGD